MTRNKRDIRMSNEEWEGFKRLLGPEWLRAKVRRELVKEKRQAIPKVLLKAEGQ